MATISSGIFSCMAYSKNDTWWNKQIEYHHSEVSKIVNQISHPLVAATWYNIRTLNHSLAPTVKLQDIRFSKDIASVGQDFNVVFVYKNKGMLDYFLENNPNYKIKNVYEWKKQVNPIITASTKLWQLEKEKSIQEKI